MQYSKEEKAMWLEDWQQSGKSAWVYAKENGLCPQTFVNWAKPKKTESKSCFVEVSVPIVPQIQDSQEILIEKGDVKIHIPLSLGQNVLQTIMERLGSRI